MTHDQVWGAIEQFAGNHGLSCSGLAKNSGLDPTTFNRSKRFSREGQARWPSMHSLAKILAATRSDITEFAKYLPKKETD
jgi:phage repressor protein C with HTH and peptisase S24 domain